MNKIIVTEAQAKVIEGFLKQTYSKSAMAHYIYCDLKETLDLVTIARIVEGESYEVNYDFKVGDIVYKRHIGLYEITEKEEFKADTISIGDVNLEVEQFTLVCKYENRADMEVSI